jgi:hypothetical protein
MITEFLTVVGTITRNSLLWWPRACLPVHPTIFFSVSIASDVLMFFGSKGICIEKRVRFARSHISATGI